MWLVLTFVACLSGSQERCRNVEIVWEGSPFQCVMFGQNAAARWIAEHEGWEMAGGWRCINGQGV